MVIIGQQSNARNPCRGLELLIVHARRNDRNLKISERDSGRNRYSACSSKEKRNRVCRMQRPAAQAAARQHNTVRKVDETAW